jgi:hypothetical protein
VHEDQAEHISFSIIEQKKQGNSKKRSFSELALAFLSFLTFKKEYN